MMKPMLLLPEDFAEYAWEIEAKGVWVASVRVGEGHVPVAFYDPVRLAQEIEGDIAAGRSTVLRRTVVVESVTEASMRAALARTSAEFFG